MTVSALRSSPDCPEAGAERLDEALSLESIERTVETVAEGILKRQKPDGHWVYELEADATIPAEYIFLNRYLDTPEPELEAKLANYLRSIQNPDGGWPLFDRGASNISASVKGYYALKMVGDDIDASHMAKARACILALGGAEKANVFTRFALALFGQVPWKAVPVTRPETILLPLWFPFHISKVSYWSRTVMVPLFVLCALKPRARNPEGTGVQELFVTPPEKIRKWQANPLGSRLGQKLLILDRILHAIEPLFPKFLERKAIARCMDFTLERLNGEDGLGAIFPAMANSVMAMDALGYSHEDPHFTVARKSIRNLVVEHGDRAYCQPCVSPVWDTGLAVHALLEAGLPGDHPAIAKATDWLTKRQILDVEGDWIWQRPGLRPGGWAFQYRNDYYPDVDDTAVVALALHRANPALTQESVSRAAEWVEGMQCGNGGWAAFDAENEHYHLNHIPFADHGALLDPPTLDVSARCLSLLAQLGYDKNSPRVADGLEYMRIEQETDGSWFGRWGTNYIYGTWSALCAFNAAGENMEADHIRKAVDWLKSRQREDGGWGEDCASYWDESKDVCHESTPSQTAWALLGLMAAGEVDSPEVAKGIAYLMKAPRELYGKWHEERYTAVGFPKVFYLRYHGYSAYFPLWALARYKNLKRTNSKRPAYGM
ncbi:MAG: squalene--hopene cyclase [Alphaproteobacteria bacterium]|nr:squalene--hopene cyclase [Alphaproteobacteria bacterium]